MLGEGFRNLITDLTRDAQRAHPKDPLQFCATWFQTRLEEERARARDLISHNKLVPGYDDLYGEYGEWPKPQNMKVLPRPPAQYTMPYQASPRADAHPYPPEASTSAVAPWDSRPPSRQPIRQSISPGPFGTLDVPGNALLPNTPLPPRPIRGGPQSDYTMEPIQRPPSANTFLSPLTAPMFQRRTSVSAESLVVNGFDQEELPIYPKSADQLDRIRACMSDNFMFRDLDNEQETGVLNAMQEKIVPAGEVVIRQGDVGDYFYIVESGFLQCYIRPEPLPASWARESELSSEDQYIKPGYHQDYGRKVADCKPGTSFGELALMYGHPRAATVMAVEASTLWALDRITFRTIILKAAHRRRTMYEYFLQSVTLLASLDAPERSKIADALVSREYKDGEAVVRQGDLGDTFFFVEEGEAIVTKSHKSEDGQVREVTVGRLKKGDYFGELSLLSLEPRAATVSAINRGDQIKPKLKVAALDAVAFTRLLGPLREIMERTATENYGPQAAYGPQ